MSNLVDKSGVTKLCEDDFVFRKIYSYETVMVDLESHRINDPLDSRETGTVEKWLKSNSLLTGLSRSFCKIRKCRLCMIQGTVWKGYCLPEESVQRVIQLMI